MNGILVIDKPAGITSHDVVSRVRRVLGTRRVGHTGTLDPFATGVMVLLVGNATRLAQFLDKDEKEYVAEMRFGFETDTGDVTGTPKPETKSQHLPGREEIEKALQLFLGEIEQTPPMYSAKKVEGKKLYELAREGKEIERKRCVVRIHELELLHVEGDVARIRVVCSAGTYVRTLAEDLARSTGTSAHLIRLDRHSSGRFKFVHSVSIDTPTLETYLLDSSQALSHLREFVVADDRIEKTRSGLSTRSLDADFRDGEYVRMTSPEGELIAVGIYASVENSVRPKVVLA